MPECKNMTTAAKKPVSKKASAEYAKIQQKQDIFSNFDQEMGNEYDGQQKPAQYIYEYGTMHQDHDFSSQYHSEQSPEKYEQLPEPMYLKYPSQEQQVHQYAEKQIEQAQQSQSHRFIDNPQAQRLVEMPQSHRFVEVSHSQSQIEIPQAQRLIEIPQQSQRQIVEPQRQLMESQPQSQIQQHEPQPHRAKEQQYLRNQPSSQHNLQTPISQHFSTYHHHTTPQNPHSSSQDSPPVKHNRLPTHKFRLNNLTPIYNHQPPIEETAAKHVEADSDYDTKPEHVHYHYSAPGEHKQVEETYYESPKPRVNFTRFQSAINPTPQPFPAPKFRFKKPIQMYRHPDEKQFEKQNDYSSHSPVMNPTEKPPQYKSYNPSPSKFVDSYGMPVRNQPDFQKQFDSEYPNAVKIEIPRDEIYKHIETSVHKIIRELKEKKEKEISSKIQSGPVVSNWQNLSPQDGNNKFEKEQRFPRPEQRLRSQVAVATTMQPPEYNDSPREYVSSPEPYYSNPVNNQKQNGRSEHQPQIQHQQPQIQHYPPPKQQQQQPLNSFSGSRYHASATTFAPPPIDFENHKSAETSQRHHKSVEKPQKSVAQNVDLTMKNRPSIDLNALDVGQTWNHDTHFDHNKAMKQVQSFDYTNVPYTKYDQSESPKSNGHNGGSFGQQPEYEQGRNSQYRVPPSEAPNSQTVTPQTKFSNSHKNNDFNLQRPNSVVTPSSPTNAQVESNYKVKQEQREYVTAAPPPVRIMSQGMPVIKEMNDDSKIFKVIVDTDKMPKELMISQQQHMHHQQQHGYGFTPNPDYGQQSIQYHPNQQHILAMQTIEGITTEPTYAYKQQLQSQPPQQLNQHQQPQQKLEDDINNSQDNLLFRSRFADRQINNNQPMNWNIMTEASTDSIQYLPPPPLTRSALPYDSYSPIYNENGEDDSYHPYAGKVMMLTGPESETFYLRNKRHRGSDEVRKKVMRSMPRKSKHYKTVIKSPATELKPPPKFNKFSRKAA